MRAVDQQRSAWTIVSTAFAVMRRVECAEREGRSRRTRGFARGSIYRSSLVPIEGPPRLLIADVHLITLRDPAASSPGKSPVCRKRDWPGVRCRPADIDVGDVDGLVGALHATERAIASGRKSGVPQIDQCHSSVDRIPALGFLETEHRRI